jgi:hypothetical protein
MIPKVSSGKSFASLADYLTTGRDGTHPERVAWSTTRNLATSDPMTAAAIMDATALQNPRTTEPVYHLSLSFHPTDIVSRETMEAVADRMLHELKLEGHQVVMVAHNDRDHAHVHLMVNRVHPETFRAWDRWKDYYTIESTLRAIERDYGLHQVDGYPRSRQPESPTADRSLKQPGASKDPPQNDVRAGRQDAVTDAARAARDYAAAVSRADAADRAMADAETAKAHADQWDRAKARAESSMLRFEDSLSRIYADPSQAAQRIFAHADKPGANSAFAELYDRPGTFGALRSDSPVAKWAAGGARHEEAARGAIIDATSRGLDAYDAVRNVHGIAKAHGVEHLSLYEVAAMLQARAHHAAENANALHAARDGAPSVTDTRSTLTRALHGLTKDGIALVDQAISIAERAIVRPVVHRVGSALVGREEHGR